MKRFLGYALFCLALLLPGFGIRQLKAMEQAGKYQINIESGGTLQLFENTEAGDVKFGVTPIIQPYTIVAATSTGSATTTRMFGSLSPQVSNLYDLGESGFAWRNLIASGTIIGITATECASGSATAPCYTFTDDSLKNTGLYRQGENIMAATASGTRIFTWTPTSTNSYVTSTAERFFALNGGSVSDPAFKHQSGTSTMGFWFDESSNTINASINGQDIAWFENDGVEYFVLDADLIPSATGTAFSLGTSDYPFNNIHASGTLNVYQPAYIGPGAKPSGVNYQLVVATSSQGMQALFYNPSATVSYISFCNNATGIATTDCGAIGMNSTSWVLTNRENGPLWVGTNNITRLTLEADGDLVPFAHNSYTLGSAGLAWSGIYSSGTGLTSINVSTTRFAVTGLAAAANGLSAMCVDANGNATKDASGTCTASSLRYKDNIKDYFDGLNFLLATRPVSFNFKNSAEQRFGLIAEEVEKIDPRFVVYENGDVNGVKYVDMAAVYASAIQEQQKLIDELYLRLSALENKTK